MYELVSLQAFDCAAAEVSLICVYIMIAVYIVINNSIHNMSHDIRMNYVYTCKLEHM